MIGPHYKVIERLGAGASGIVYKVRSQDGDIEALKLSKADMFHSDKARRQFIRELKTARQLSHDRLVPLFNLEYLPRGAVFYTMKYMSGGDLSRKLAEAVRADRRLEPRQVLTWMAQVAEALAYIHQKGMVHQDVEPGNILLGEDGQAYLGDFGLIFKILSLNFLESLSQTRSRVDGSPRFMSPEQQKVVFYQREAKITAASDCYSFGLTLYALLTGEMGGRTDSLAHVLGESPLTQKLDAFLSRCLHREPHKRFANGRDIAQALERLLANAAPEGSTPQTLFQDQRQPAKSQEPMPSQSVPRIQPTPNKTDDAGSQRSPSPSSETETTGSPVSVREAPPTPKAEPVAPETKVKHAKAEAEAEADTVAPEKQAVATETPSKAQKVLPQDTATAETPVRTAEPPAQEPNKAKEKKDWATLRVIPLVVALIGVVSFLWPRLFPSQSAKYWVKDPHVAINQPLVFSGNETAGESKNPLHIKLGDFMYGEAAISVEDDPPGWQFIPGELPSGTKKLQPGTYQLHVGATNQTMLQLTKVIIEKAK